METPEHIERLRIVGGDVAFDFVNTEEGERLGGEADLRPEDAEAVYRDALRLRGALYGVFRNLAEGGDVPERGLETLRGYEREALSRGKLVQGDRGFSWEWKDGRDLAGMLWPVAHAATRLLTSGDLDRLKLCAGCYWVFLDASRNRSRRWCTMEVCGTDEKKRRYVAKRAAGREAERHGA